MNNKNKLIIVSIFIFIASAFIYYKYNSNKSSQSDHELSHDKSSNRIKSKQASKINIESNKVSRPKGSKSEKIIIHKVRPERKLTKIEKSMTSLFLKRNPNQLNAKLEITHVLKEKGAIIAIVHRGTMNFTAEIDSKTGKILRSWSKTRYEYDRNAPKLRARPSSK